MTPSVSVGTRPVWRGTAFTLLLLLLLIAGCGRKGPLFLPQEKLQEAERALERRDQAPPIPAPTLPPASPGEQTPPK